MIPEKVKNKFSPNVLKKYCFNKAKYKGALARIEGIVCPTHGEFSQYSAQLRKYNGSHCPQCGITKRAKAQAFSVGEVAQRVEEIHKGRVGLEKSSYKGLNSRARFICVVHGEFNTSPNKVIYAKQGCPECGGLRRGVRKDVLGSARKTAETKVEEFRGKVVPRARVVHGETYKYDLSTYKGMRTPMRIICSTHGDFFQSPANHINLAQGCPSCNYMKSSGEDEVASYLAAFTKVERRNRTIIAPYELDIVLPEHKVAVEYCGEYWHSSGGIKEEAEARVRHKRKYALAKEAGYHLVTLYESEWKDRNKTIRRLLRNLIGKNKGKVMARKCSIAKITPAQAKEFYEEYHPQGGNGYGEHYALVYKDKIIACARFTKGINDRGANTRRIWTLSRYATRINVNGGASRLLAAFVREHAPKEVKSFSDNRFFSGKMYEELGFKVGAELSPDYKVWSPKLGLSHKSHYQRRNINQRLEDHGLGRDFCAKTDARSERDMTYFMGCRRIWDCGKLRWVIKYV